MSLLLFLLSTIAVLAQNPAEVAVSDPWQINVEGSGNSFYFWDYSALSTNGVLDHTLQGRLQWNGGMADPSVPSPGPDNFIRVTEDGALGYGLEYVVETPVILSADVDSMEKLFFGDVLVIEGALWLRTPPDLPLENTALKHLAFNIALRIVVL